MRRVLKLIIIPLAIEASFLSEFRLVRRNMIASNSYLLDTYSASIIECVIICKTTDTCYGVTFNREASSCVLLSFCPDERCDTMANDEGSETFCLLEQRLRDCKAVQEAGYDKEDIYLLYPFGPCHATVWAYCDMVTDGGGWTIFHYRKDGSENFTQNWTSYRDGFGSTLSEYWLGNAVIHELTFSNPSSLYVKMKAHKGVWKYARYDSFFITNEADNFRLSVDTYSGDAGDSLQSTYSPTLHDGKNFSTYDRDNDENPTRNCASVHRGGWWYAGCHTTNLNGQYCGVPETINTLCNTWSSYNGSHLGLEHSIMMFRRN